MRKRDIIFLIAVGILLIVGTAFLTSIVVKNNLSGELKVTSSKLEQAEKTIADLTSKNNELSSIIANTEPSKTTEYEDTISNLETQLNDANATIETLQVKLSDIQTENISGNNSSYKTLGSASETVILDDDCMSNIITAAGLLHNTSIGQWENLSVYSVIGTYKSQGYVLNVNKDGDPDYADGVEYLTNLVFKAAVQAGLQIVEYDTLDDGKVYVGDNQNLVIKNNTDKDITIQCKYIGGVLTVDFYIK